MPTLNTRIDALEKRAPDFRQQFMHDLMRYVDIRRVSIALEGGHDGTRALLAEVYWKKTEKSGCEAADAWVQHLTQNLPRLTKQGD